MDNNEYNFAVLEEKISTIKEDIKELKDSMQQHIKWEQARYNEIDDKHAGKWVEKILITTLAALISGLAVGIILSMMR